jgi:tRNA threonylcarbamoyl adenosine modification protein YeaZ
MNYLSIDSTTGRMSVSFSKDNHASDGLVDDKGSRHVKNIISIIDKILERNKTDISELDLFGVNLGPGDFTGTRIGITVVKMFSWLSGKEAFGFNALDVTASMLAYNQDENQNIGFLLAPVLDVRNGELYYSFFKASKQPFSLERISGYELCDIGSFPGSLIYTYTRLFTEDPGLDELNILLGGTGLSNYPDVFKTLEGILIKKGISSSFNSKNIYSDSRDVQRLLRYHLSKGSKPVKDIYPIYVRDFKVFGK